MKGKDCAVMAALLLGMPEEAFFEMTEKVVEI